MPLPDIKSRYGRIPSHLTETLYVHIRTVKYAAWSSLFFTKLRDSEQTGLILYRQGYPFSTASKAAEFQEWFAKINGALFWGGCGQIETDFEVVRFLFPNQWLAEQFEWRHYGRLTFLDGTLEAAAIKPIGAGSGGGTS